jgi:MFS family permease
VGAALGLYRLAEFGPWIAILVFAYDHGGATATGIVSLGLLVPTALAAPLGGPVIDRYGAGRVLAAGYAAQALAMGATAASMLAGAPPLVCCVFGVGGAGSKGVKNDVSPAAAASRRARRRDIGVARSRAIRSRGRSLAAA